MRTEPSALLQKILMRLLDAAGYKSGGEFDFKARRDWQPRPDVAILPEGDERYPSTLSLVIEILSDDQTKELDESVETTQRQAFLTSLSWIRQRNYSIAGKKVSWKRKIWNYQAEVLFRVLSFGNNYRQLKPNSK